MLRTLMTAAVAATLMSGGAFAATFDSVFVESNAARGMATGDIADRNIGTITGGKVGLAGRIFNFEDVWSFESTREFTVSLTDLAIDGNAGYDSTSIFGATNGIKNAEFSLVDLSTTTTLFSTVLTSTTPPPAFAFTAGPGAYELVIDGSIDVQAFGSTYDVGIALVPIPAALPLLGAGLGVLGLMRRRSRV